MHHQNLISDPKIYGKVIALQETWCNNDHDNNHLKMPGYKVHLVSQGNGKGIATYYQSDYSVTGTVNKALYQISRVSSNNIHIINLYISRGANKREFLQDLGALAKGKKPCIIVGDFNIDFLNSPNELIITQIISKLILSNGFHQIVTLPTHDKGGLIDHIYIKNVSEQIDVSLNFPFYSDHAAILVTTE